MASRLLLSVLVLVGWGCQRLEDDEPFEPTSLGDGTGGDDEGTDGGTFLPGDAGNESDDGSVPMSECDPVTQTGCASGDKCTAITTSTGPVYICVGAGGSDLEPLDPCQPDPMGGLDACPAGTVCLGTASAGVCALLCGHDGDCELGTCAEHPEHAIPHCADDCSPFEAACPSPMQCRRGDERFSCVFPREEDVGGAGAPCSASDDAGCAAGFACVAGTLVPGCAEVGCCTPLCDLSAADTCSAPATCNQALTMPAPGFETIGACFVPS